MGKFQNELETYMDAGIPMLYVDTLEYDKVEGIVIETAKRNRRNIIHWSQRGLDYCIHWKKNKENKYTYEEKPDKAFTKDLVLLKALETIMSDDGSINHSILVLDDVHFFIDKPENIARLRELAYRINRGDIEECTVIISAPLENIPKELESYLTVMMLDYLTDKEIKELILQIIEENGSNTPQAELLDRLVMMLKGLSETEIRNVLSLVLTKDNVIEVADLPLIMKQKQQMVQKSGILEMVETAENMDKIGGLENLKQWLRRKGEVLRNIKKAQSFGVDMPKGVLIAGMPGCGKSLTAKATATSFNLPLLRMDMGRLMGKYVGESEGNMRRALRLTEASSPCVLWIDELEKAFAGVRSGGGGSEVTTRLFGNFLTWMQEKNSLAFVVATANDISELPPELMRKGRFDEIFYVGFPNKEERKKIFAIHIKNRRPKDLNGIDIAQLVDKTEGYCGADIEGVVREAVEAAFVEGKDSLSTEDLLNAINSTNPISETMKEQIEKMDAQYKEKKFTNASR